MRRYSWWDGEEYDEVLSLEPSAVRLGRLNAGAPFVDTHATYCLDNVIGSVVPDTARIEDGRGLATILLSAAPGVADTVQKIREGVIRNISVGYWLHKVVKTEADDGSVARHDVVDWEPLEISAVPVPADAGSQIRSAEGEEGEAQTRSSCLIVTRSPASRPNTPANQETSMARTAKPATPKAARTAKTPAEIEAEKKRRADERAAAQRAAARDEDETDDEERDEESEDERAGDDAEDGDGGSDDERSGDDEDDGDETRDGDDEGGEDESERSAPAVAARRAAEKAVKAERVRSATITAMAERAGMPKLGRKHVEAGTSAKRFGDIVLERMLKSQERRGNATFAGNGAEEIGTERSAGHQGREQREFADGEAHWRRVAGKPAKAA